MKDTTKMHILPIISYIILHTSVAKSELIFKNYIFFCFLFSFNILSYFNEILSKQLVLCLFF